MSLTSGSTPPGPSRPGIPRPRPKRPAADLLGTRIGCTAECRRPLEHRSVWVTVVTSALFAALAAKRGLTWALLPELVLAAVLVPLAWCDAEHLLLPKKLIRVGLAGVGLAILVVAAATNDWHGVLVAALCAATCGALLGFVSLLRPALVGFGDARMAALIGLGLGFSGVNRLVAGLVLANLAAGIVSLGLVVTGRSRVTPALPFGVFLAGGAIVALLIGR